jgi:hypothetical protein
MKHDGVTGQGYSILHDLIGHWVALGILAAFHRAHHRMARNISRKHRPTMEEWRQLRFRGFCKLPRAIAIFKRVAKIVQTGFAFDADIFFPAEFSGLLLPLKRRIA